jgi:hypothetical protein
MTREPRRQGRKSVVLIGMGQGVVFSPTSDSRLTHEARILAHICQSQRLAGFPSVEVPNFKYRPPGCRGIREERGFLNLRAAGEICELAVASTGLD